MSDFTAADYEALGLGPEIGDTKRCSYMATPDARCDLVAIVHALVTANTFDNVTACGKHWPTCRKALAPLQWHPVAEDCGVPGSVWNSEENRCEFDPSLFEFRSELSEATV